MLIRRAVLERIRAGEVSLAFRVWKRPTVKAGGTLRTAVGLLAIDAIERIDAGQITAADAAAAGFEGRRAALREIEGRSGDLYRIALRYAGEDPRRALREQTSLSEAEAKELRARLVRLDRASRRGPWTLATLRAIGAHPRLRAAELAVELGQERDWLKRNVRKLKNLGLTVSHHPGYTLSPRGRTTLRRLESAGSPSQRGDDDHAGAGTGP